MAAVKQPTACKFTVLPHAKTHGERTGFPVSQRGFRDAKRHGVNIAARAGSATIFLSCAGGSIGIASCSDLYQRGGGSLCRVEGETGGASIRTLAGTSRPRRRGRR
jgi:hypothetical protein